MKNPFDYFDKIYCVCAKHETERWKHAVTQFEKVGILDRVEKFDEVIDLDWVNSEFGEGWNRTDYCHFRIIMDTHKQGLENVFIFESDVHFINTDLELMQKSIETLDTVDWKLFYMGGIPHMVYDVENEHLINASMCQAHAYAINGKYCKEVAKILKNNKMPIDQVYKRGKKFGLSYGSYATHPRFVVQEDPDLLTRKQVSNIMWEKAVEPMIDLHRRGIEFITMSATHEGSLHRKIINNLKKSLDLVGVPASTGFVGIEGLEKNTEYDKLNRIHGILEQGRSCLFTDPDVVFLKNPMEYLLKEFEEYDLIIQSNVREKEELKYFKKILNPGFCLVRSTELTMKLFDTKETLDLLYGDVRVDETYFNSKLNSSDEYFKNLKIKILDEDEFCVSFENYERLKELDPYMVHYNELPTRIFHPKNKIGRMKQNGHWFI